MENERYTPGPEHKFTFGLWTVGNRGADPFGSEALRTLRGERVDVVHAVVDDVTAMLVEIAESLLSDARFVNRSSLFDPLDGFTDESHVQIEAHAGDVT